jgi:hypothetical protein
MMRVPVLLLLSGLLFVASASAQTGITVEATAGLAFPTETDFKDGFETGLALGVRGSYGITDALRATLGVQYNRFSSKDVFVEGIAAKSAGSNGFDAQFTYNLFGIRGGVQYVGDLNETVGFFVGAEAGPTSQKVKSDFGDSNAEWDATIGLYAGGRYHFTPGASVGIGPAFTIILAENNIHFVDFVVNVAFAI